MESVAVVVAKTPFFFVNNAKYTFLFAMELEIITCIVNDKIAASYPTKSSPKRHFKRYQKQNQF